MVHIYSTEETIHQFAIGYMINNSLCINTILREQGQKCLGCSFYVKTMKTIRNCLWNKNTSVMALIMVYETVWKDTRKVYRVLGCVVYNLIDS